MNNVLLRNRSVNELEFWKNGSDIRAVVTQFFNGKCKTLIEGYRYIPAGETWTREDGVVFAGEIVSFWKPHTQLIPVQQQYEEDLIEISDMQSALELLGV